MSVNIYNSNPNASSEAENFQTVADRGSKLASDTIYSNTTSGLNSVNVQGAIDEVNEKVDPIKARTHTNLLNPTAQTQTRNGVTFTNNGDGTYTVNGTASADIVFNNVYRTTAFPTGINTKLIGCPSGGSTSSYYMAIVMEGVGPYYDSGNGVEIPLTSSANALRLLIGIKSGTTCDNLLFKPMLTTDLNAKYDDYVPYSGSGALNKNVAELYEAISQINSDLTDKSFSVTASNSSINLTSFDCKRFGSMAKISMFGTTVRQLEANKAYFIPNLYINGMQNVNLYGCGITRTSSSLNDDADSFPCVVSISDHSVCFTPLVTMPSNFGMVIELLCYLVS